MHSAHNSSLNFRYLKTITTTRKIMENLLSAFKNDWISLPLPDIQQNTYYFIYLSFYLRERDRDMNMCSVVHSSNARTRKKWIKLKLEDQSRSSTWSGKNQELEPSHGTSQDAHSRKHTSGVVSGEPPEWPFQSMPITVPNDYPKDNSSWELNGFPECLIHGSPFSILICRIFQFPAVHTQLYQIH